MRVLIATAIAKDATEAAAVAAEAEAKDEPSAVNTLKADRARKTANDAAADAAMYAEMPVDDDDDDMAGDDDDDMAGDDDDDMAAGDDDGDMMPEVTANGVGNLLKFSLWTTTYDRDTLLAVTNPGYGPANVRRQDCEQHGYACCDLHDLLGQRR